MQASTACIELIEPRKRGRELASASIDKELRGSPLPFLSRTSGLNIAGVENAASSGVARMSRDGGLAAQLDELQQRQW